MVIFIVMESRRDRGTGKSRLITASMLYNLTICPHRLYLDLCEDPARMVLESPFVGLLISYIFVALCTFCRFTAA